MLPVGGLGIEGACLGFHPLNQIGLLEDERILVRLDGDIEADCLCLELSDVGVALDGEP